MDRFIEVANIVPKTHLTDDFRLVASEFFENLVICNDGHEYEAMEVEFLLQTVNGTHNDPFIDADQGQRKMAHWYLPVRGGVDLTFGCEHYAAAIFLRTIRDTVTGTELSGPARIFRLLFQNAGSALGGSSGVFIRRRETPLQVELLAVPRANLPVDHHSADLERRLKYAFRPYRFLRADIHDFKEKYIGGVYLNQVQGVDHLQLQLQPKKYSRYLESFQFGATATDIEQVWQRSHPSLRMSALMGFLNASSPEDLR